MSDYPIRHIAHNPQLTGLAQMIPDITFTDREDNPLVLQLLQPWALQDEQGQSISYPCVVFVQGSGWKFPNVYFEIPQLAELAREGYVVATVTHRNSQDGHKAPAFLEDVKTAIRFLRAKAADLHIDPTKLGIWGTSSGGNAALLAGLTIDNPKYKTAEWADQSDKVNFVVDCFGPADGIGMVKEIEDKVTAAMAHFVTLSPEEQAAQAAAGEDLKETLVNFIGLKDGKPDTEVIKEISPLHWIDKDKTYPPFLIIHGDQDETVGYDQSVRLYHALRDHGTEAEMICVNGAPHEGSFWSQEVLDNIFTFIEDHIG